MSDLDALFPGTPITVGGLSLAVMPLRFGQLAKATAALQTLTAAIRAAGILSFSGQTMTLATDWPLRIPQVIAEGGEAVVDLVALATGKPRSWVEGLAADEGILLVKTIVEVNGDFFVKRIAPMMPGAIATTGGASLPDSSTPATVSTPSAATH